MQIAPRGQCIAVIAMRTVSLSCLTSRQSKCRAGCGRKSLGSAYLVFSLVFLRGVFRNLRAGKSRTEVTHFLRVCSE